MSEDQRTGADPQPSSRPPWMGRERRKTRRQTSPDRTGRALRQQIPTPGINELRTSQRAILKRLDRAASNTAMATDGDLLDQLTPDMFHDKDALTILDALRKCVTLSMVIQLYNDSKIKSGRPAAISAFAFMVGLFLTVKRGGGCLMTEVANTLYHRLHPVAMGMLGIRPPALDPVDIATATGMSEQLHAQLRRQEQAEAKCVLRAFHRLCAVMGPEIYPPGREHPWTVPRRPLTDEEIEERMNRLILFINDLIRIPWRLLPPDIRTNHRHMAGIDATPFPVFSHGRGVNSTIAATEPMAGFYVRTGDHSELQQQIKRAFFAYDIHTITAVDCHDGRQYAPTLAIAITMNRPGEDPYGAARRMAVNLEVALPEWEPGNLSGDGIYPNGAPTQYQIPLREIGYELIHPILNAHLGLQAVVEGYLLVEGRFYCPSMPKVLIEATRDLRQSRIDLATYQARIHERMKYEARLKQNEGPNKMRFDCPASGTKPTVMCALQERSQAEDRRTFIAGPQLKVRDRIHPTAELLNSDELPRPCAQTSITIDLTKHPDAAKHWQSIPFGTPEHTDAYNAPRQSHEGFHGRVKDEAKEAFAAAGKRRVSGYAEHAVMAAVIIALAGIRNVHSFLRRAKVDRNGRRYVRPRRRTGDHARSGLPPGTVRERDDP